MPHKIKKYPVRHPLLKRYIKFFWEIRADHIQLNHKVIPVRNIDLKFNLSETPQYLHINGSERLIENVHFSGLQDHFRNAYIRINGKADTLGICFLPNGFYPFLRIPMSEFKNQLLGTNEIGLKEANTIWHQLKETPDVFERLRIIEHELVALLRDNDRNTESFQQLIEAIKYRDSSLQISEFCRENNISMRKLERLYQKFVGVSAKSYDTLNRFQNGLNQLLFTNYSKLSDIAFDNGYFDQTHFIKEFKRYTGNTPKRFVRKNESMIQVGEFT